MVSKKDIVNRNTGEKIASITVSGGVSEYISGESISDLIDRADDGLYESKNQGRNSISSVSRASSANAAHA